MTETTPTTARDELLDPDALPSFQIRNKKEIRHLLRSIADKRFMLTAHIDGGPLTFVTAVLDLTVDGESVILDTSRDEKIMERVERAEKLVCTGRLDGVRVQFSADSPEGFPHDGFEALRCDLPEMMLRLQRRETFRLPVPMSSPVGCKLLLQDEEGQPTPIQVRVLDLSAEGIGLLLEEGCTLEPGQVINSELTMPDLGAIQVGLRMRNLFKQDNRGGSTSLRAGFQLIEPAPRLVSAIQRYIFKVERERRMLETDR